MSQIMYNYPAMLAHAGEMSGYAGAMHAVGADIASEQAALAGAWQGDTGMTYQAWQAQWNTSLEELVRAYRAMAATHETNTDVDERPRCGRRRQVGWLTLRWPSNAVELTAEQAWFVADTFGAGSFPWVLAITPPYSDPSQRVAVRSRGCPRELAASG